MMDLVGLIIGMIEKDISQAKIIPHILGDVGLRLNA